MTAASIHATTDPGVKLPLDVYFKQNAGKNGLLFFFFLYMLYL